jgi:hypothetical protein
MDDTLWNAVAREVFRKGAPRDVDTRMLANRFRVKEFDLAVTIDALGYLKD